MIDEIFLRSLGFTEFMHLRKSKRDGRKRLICTAFYYDALLTILLLEQNGHWIIDKLIFDETSAAKNELSIEMDLEELINIVFEKLLTVLLRKGGARRTEQIFEKNKKILDSW